MRIQRFLLAASLAAPSAFAETVELTNGDRLSGEVIERTLDGVVIEHPMLGRITLAADQIEPAKQANPGLFGTDFVQGWTREIGIGLNGSEGDAANLNLRTTLNLSLENERHRWRVRGRYIYQTEDRETTDDNAVLAMNHA